MVTWILESQWWRWWCPKWVLSSLLNNFRYQIFHSIFNSNILDELIWVGSDNVFYLVYPFILSNIGAELIFLDYTDILCPLFLFKLLRNLKLFSNNSIYNVKVKIIIVLSFLYTTFANFSLFGFLYIINTSNIGLIHGYVCVL